MALDEVAVLVPVELDALCKLTHELCEPDVQEIWPLPRIPQGGVPGLFRPVQGRRARRRRASWRMPRRTGPSFMPQPGI